MMENTEFFFMYWLCVRVFDIILSQDSNGQHQTGKGTEIWGICRSSLETGPCSCYSRKVRFTVLQLCWMSIMTHPSFMGKGVTSFLVGFWKLSLDLDPAHTSVFVLVIFFCFASFSVSRHHYIYLYLYVEYRELASFWLDTALPRKGIIPCHFDDLRHEK